MKNFLALALAAFSFAAVNADVVVDDSVTTLPVEETTEVSENVNDSNGCAECSQE